MTEIIQQILKLNPNPLTNEYMMVSKTYGDPAEVYFLSYYELVETAEGWEHFQFYRSSEFKVDEICMEFLNNEPAEDYTYFKINKFKGEHKQ